MVRLDNLSFTYANAKTPVLSNLDLHLPPGSFHFLIGPSGAGKTSLLKLIAMELAATAGQMVVFGRDLATLDRDQRAHMRRKIGYVFQDFRLLPHMTVQANVALPLKIAGAYGRQQADQVQELLAWVGLGDVAQKYPLELSGGEQQRVAIARSVINRPTLLLADEPTGNVDELMAERLMHLFMELHRGGTTVLLATHNASLASRFDRPILRLDQGHISHVAVDINQDAGPDSGALSGSGVVEVEVLS